VERLSSVALARRGDGRVLQRLYFDIPERKLVSRHDRFRRDPPHHLVTVTFEIDQRFAQHHQSTAFGIDDAARSMKRSNRLLHGVP